MNEKKLDKISINWYPGHMAKTKREIKEKIDLIDIVYEVIDSRMPKSSRIKDLDEIIGNKPRIIVFTKYDMCDESVTDKYIKKYEKDYVVIKTNLKENSNIIKTIISKTEELLHDINEKRLAGVTKNISWIKLNKDIELMDTPGILWPKIEEETVAYNLASLTSIKEEILNMDDIAIYIIRTLYKYYPNLLKEKYGIDSINDINMVFDLIGRRRGCLAKGNIVDLEKVYTIILNDLKEGKIGKVTFDR